MILIQSGHRKFLSKHNPITRPTLRQAPLALLEEGLDLSLEIKAFSSASRWFVITNAAGSPGNITEGVSQVQELAGQRGSWLFNILQLAYLPSCRLLRAPHLSRLPDCQSHRYRIRTLDSPANIIYREYRSSDDS